MNRIFNIAGPCNPNDHYMIDAFRRLGDEIYSLIGQKQYFVIHAARQSGKTTLLLELAGRINKEGGYYALYCSLEKADTVENPEEGMPIILKSIKWALENSGMPNAQLFQENIDENDPYNALQSALTAYCRAIDKPLVLLFDEVDCLNGRTLISFLRQLRNGYITRASIPFVHSLALAGMRNIRDYRDEYRLSEQTLGSASPFNIVKAYLTLRNFTHGEISELYAQHTSETGRVFDDGAIELAWSQTQGQPWLVNAIACEVVEHLAAGDFQRPVTADMVSAAIQTIMQRRDTHFDSLVARLREGRVRRIVEPMLVGEMGDISFDSDDYIFVRDIGLIRDDRGKIEPANPIYGEMIVRVLNRSAQTEMEIRGYKYKMPRYLKDNAIDMDYLLKDFQAFWRENSGIWRKKFDYQEAAPQLILQAFLQRILNGGGQIIREMAVAAGRVDLCVAYLDRKYPIEMKIRYGEDTYSEGIEQILRYMDILGSNKGWLVVFDHRQEPAWEEKLFCRKADFGTKTVMIYGC